MLVDCKAEPARSIDACDGCMTIPVIEDHPQMWELPNRILCDVMMPVLDLIVGTPPPTPDAFVDFGGWLLTSSLGF